MCVFLFTIYIKCLGGSQNFLKGIFLSVSYLQIIAIINVPNVFNQQGAGSYSQPIKKVEEGIQSALKKVNELTGSFLPFLHCFV